MTHPHVPNDAIAASIPWTLHQLDEFVLSRPDLEGIAELSVSATRGHVVIYVDAKWAEDWTDALDKSPAPVFEERAGAPSVGTHHEAHGVLNGVRVAVKWFVLAGPVKPLHLRLVDAHADAFHVPCEGGYEEAAGHVTLCLDDSPRPLFSYPHGTVERACPHGRDLCGECRSACAECVDDARQDGAGRS